MNFIKFLNRKKSIFFNDVKIYDKKINHILKNSKVLIVGGAGSIGQAVAKELFFRNTKLIDIIDINENGLVELVRDIRSSHSSSNSDLKTFAIDVGSVEFKLFMKYKKYDYVLNLSALKHVRSEKDPYTLHRMTVVNIFNPLKILKLCRHSGLKKYFCVSTDKASDPANMMGASKRIMELVLFSEKKNVPISMARFANVYFSDGSLLHGFQQRFFKNQPLSSPSDISRFFITAKEAAELCILSCILGKNREIYFPKKINKIKLIKFSEIAISFLKNHNYEAVIFNSEKRAIIRNKLLIKNKKWALHLFKSDTTGEKKHEEFFSKTDKIYLNNYKNIGIIKNTLFLNKKTIEAFSGHFKKLKYMKLLSKKHILNVYKIILPSFFHIEKNKHLDQRM